ATAMTRSEPLQSPDHPEKVCCAFGVAVSVTVGCVSPSYVALQSSMQLAMLPVTGSGDAPAATLPPPTTLTRNVCSLDSTAPTSQPAPCGRAMPRMSSASTQVPVSMATLPAPSSSEATAPPWLPSVPSCGSPAIGFVQ